MDDVANCLEIKCKHFHLIFVWRPQNIGTWAEAEAEAEAPRIVCHTKEVDTQAQKEITRFSVSVCVPVCTCVCVFVCL